MKKIAILSSSIREGRKSHNVALYFKNYIETNKLAETEILDLKEYNFCLFEERLKYMKVVDDAVSEFASKIANADGIIIVSPEYNGGYPASLKNVIDLLIREWQGKPVAISTVSNGSFGGSQVLTSLQFVLWKIGARVVTAMFPVPHVEKSFDEKGTPADSELQEKRAERFIKELLDCIEGK